MNSCNHQSYSCINPYELIRKYRCLNCNEIAMCSCEREHAERFLPHQLSEGCVLETQERVPVTLGFQDMVCPECRGETSIHAPRASTPGATSKVARYYWREIHLEVTKRFYELNPKRNPRIFEEGEFSFPEERNAIEREVIAEMKVNHQINPKYDYSEKPQSEVIEETGTEIILVQGAYIQSNDRRASLQGKSGAVGVEEYAIEYYSELDYSAIETESVPFHVLFGVYMWKVIQDPADSLCRAVRFGSRTEYDRSIQNPSQIEALLPSDFGTSEYYVRREEEINRHIFGLANMVELFEDWKLESSAFREYLWAHRQDDVDMAAKIVRLLAEADLKKILAYLCMNYWKNYCGWPDLLVYSPNEYFFVEVKSSNNKLSEDQKNWLMGNREHIGLQAKIFKIGKQKA